MTEMTNTTQGKELQVQEKKELKPKDEGTYQARFFIPHTDIFETDEGLTVVLEMPGVGKDQVSVDVEDERLAIEGRIDFSNYAQLDPVYTEYNVGHYRRSFTLPDKVDLDKITADLKDGVLTVHLPKAEEVKPRKIPVN